jgi:thiamine-monophosphate kinase
MKGAADLFQCAIVGGDTGAWDGKLVMTVTILGRSAGFAPITRCGAKPEEGIYVTGALGGSRLGRHMTFMPRVHEGVRIGSAGWATAMIDISDGLSRDLPRICEQSGVGAIVEASRIPIHADANAAASRDRHSPLEHALHDGEDHELLFTGPVQPLEGCIRIGTITAEPGVHIDHDGAITPLEPRGWEHTF